MAEKEKYILAINSGSSSLKFSVYGIGEVFKIAKDPVCGREVEEKNFNEQSEYRSRTYYFCSNECKTRFDKNPREYEVKVILKKRKE
jgi:YHS domain-containing protein